MAPQSGWIDQLHARISVLPRRLVGPGPDEAARQLILSAAAAAPDHGQILPWRFIEVSAQARAKLADVFEQDLMDRDPDCSTEERLQAREKAERSPWLLLCVCRETDEYPKINLHERYISLGCAIQNMLLTATQLGLGSSLTTGQALRSTRLAQLAGLRPGEAMACFLSVGHVGSLPKPKARPSPADYFSVL